MMVNDGGDVGDVGGGTCSTVLDVGRSDGVYVVLEAKTVELAMYI